LDFFNSYGIILLRRWPGRPPAADCFICSSIRWLPTECVCDVISLLYYSSWSKPLSFQIRMKFARIAVQVNTHQLTTWCHTFKMAAMTSSRRLLLHMQQHPPAVLPAACLFGR